MGKNLSDYGFGVGYVESIIGEEDDEEFIAHYGTPRHSGRYPWGSGKNPQRGMDFISKSDAFKEKGLSKQEIAKAMGYESIRSYTAARSQALAAREADSYRTIDSLMKRYGGNISAVAREMGTNESTIRYKLSSRENRQATVANSTVSILRDEMNRLNGEYLDVGRASNFAIGVSESRLKTAVQTLVNSGDYVVIQDRVDQVNRPGQSTPIKVLAPAGTTWAEVKNNQDKIHLLSEAGAKVNYDSGKVEKLVDPVSLDSKRIYINYTDDKGHGGVEKDGTIEIRPGVKDLNLGNSRYAQVRVLVDDNKYMKGMAYYSNKVPEGYDCVYNTNKPVSKADDVFKKIKDVYLGPDYRPIDKFGATIVAQNKYTDDNGNEKTGVLNIMRAEGAWSNYANTLPSQFLAKQKIPVAKQQLSEDFANRAADFESIKNLNNPTLKHALLKPFADECDSAAVDLKAAAFPRQAWSVILPNPKLKDNEVYAPNFQTGEKVILVRFPHEGPYQIPLLTVNNNSRSSKEMIGNNPTDAVVINQKVANVLSGADFDGDAVLVIPAGSGKFITSDNYKGSKAVKELQEFDTKAAYPPLMVKNKEGKLVEYEAVTDKAKLKDKDTQFLWLKEKEMGVASNLIMDMTIAGAPVEHLVRATKYANVVIDVEKHSLDYKRCYREQGIEELKQMYQAKANVEPGKKAYGGSGTLLTRNKSQQQVIDRKPAYNAKDAKGNYSIKEGIDVKTGEKVWQPTGKVITSYNKVTGEKYSKPREQTSTKMMETKDARLLMSGPKHEGTEIERVYADYANRCKALGNEARKEFVSIQLPKRDPGAAKIYSKEVASLDHKLQEAYKKVPLERLANIKASLAMKEWKKQNPSASFSEKQKEASKALTRARRDVGASRYDIQITPKEWEAIQKNALSPSKLEKIFAKTDLDLLRKLATPKETNVLSDAQISRIKAYANSGRTQQEIAESLGISVGTVRKALNPNPKE
jgi:predicted transcriptional regulator